MYFTETRIKEMPENLSVELYFLINTFELNSFIRSCCLIYFLYRIIPFTLANHVAISNLANFDLNLGNRTRKISFETNHYANGSDFPISEYAISHFTIAISDL